MIPQPLRLRPWRCRWHWHAWSAWRPMQEQRVVLTTLEGETTMVGERMILWQRTCAGCGHEAWKTTCAGRGNG